MLYLEIPYQFYFDYMSDWLNGIAFKGVKEGHPHEVKVIKEAPNYQISDE